MATPVAAALGVAAGCVQPAAESQVTSASTVSDYVASGCSTGVVLGLARQISDELACENPNTLVTFDPSASIVFTNSAVLPYLEVDARDDLLAVAQTGTLQVNSAFRTVAQQYLLYQWYEAGRCGITAAATVGSSNHETGRAIDLENNAAEISAMAAHSWSHDVPDDVVHFDHNASADLRGQDTLAFQRLWNRNIPDDTIGEDGAYGPQTAARLQQAPATGFDLGPSCTGTGSGDGGSGGSTTTAAELRSIDGPDSAPPATRAHFTITIANTGTATIDQSTQLVIASGTSSPLYDSSWDSTTAIATLDAPIGPGELATIAFDVTTPNVTTQTPISQPLVFDDGTNQFGSIELAITVTPGTTMPSSGDGSEPPTGWTPPTEGGGCSTGGSGAGVLVALALVGIRRRRR